MILNFGRYLPLTGLVLLLYFSSCKNQQEENPGIIDVITLKGPSAISMVKMIEDPPTLADSIAVNIRLVDEPVKAQSILIAEKPAFVVLPTNLASILYNIGFDYRLAAIPVWGTLYLFGEDTTIREWQDLEGKRIYSMGRGLTPDAMLRYLLHARGLKPGTNVTIDYSFSTHDDLAFAVAAGKADLAVISEPLVSMVMERNTSVRPIFDFNEEWKSATPGSARCAQTSLLVRSDLADTSPRVVEEFLAAYHDAAAWVNSHKNEAARLMVKHGILDNLKVAESSIPRCNIQFERAADVEEDIMKYLSVFYNFNPDLTGGKLPDEKFIHE